MHVVVIGSNGATGALVVDQALKRNWTVTAVARRPPESRDQLARLALVSVDVMDRPTLDGVFAGVDAVVSTIGVGTSRRPTTLYSSGTANVLGAMRAQGVMRLVALTAVPAGPWSTSSWGQRHVVLPLLQRFFGSSYNDMRVMEAELAASDANWTVVRPPRLTNAAAKGRYRVSFDAPLRGGGSITRTDLAVSLLDLIGDADANQRALWVAN
jgi:putative NADH-flavin reductase